MAITRPHITGSVNSCAATALERNLMVVTTDSDFERVHDLRVTLPPRKSLETQ